jgi:L-ribulose-5-phosphate 4-epimerase
MKPTALEVVETARRMRLTGLCVSSLGNVSVRRGSRVWITPTRRLAWQLSESEVVNVDMTGAVLSGRRPSRELRLHLEIYRHFPEANSVVHTHSPWATAWSHLGRPLPGGTEELAYHEIGPIPCSGHAPAGSHTLARAACEALRSAPVALLHSHGVVAMGRSPTAAFELCAVAEQQAHLQWLIRLADGFDLGVLKESPPPPPAMVAARFASRR